MSLVEVLVLSLVGFITVFIILTIVWLLGIVLIKITNRLQLEVQNIDSQTSRSNLPSSKEKTIVGKKKIAAIITAVKILTKGKGNVLKITKIDNKN